VEPDPGHRHWSALHWVYPGLFPPKGLSRGTEDTRFHPVGVRNIISKLNASLSIKAVICKSHYFFSSPFLSSPFLSSPFLSSPFLSSPLLTSHLLSSHLLSSHLLSLLHIISYRIISYRIISYRIISFLSSPLLFRSVSLARSLNFPHPTPPHLTSPHLV
jgi:hypothetical protein